MNRKGCFAVQIWAILLSANLPFSKSQACDFYQDMQLNVNYYIYNVEYPNNYRPNSQCRWIAHSPQNSQIVFSCSEINIPTSADCQQESLTVSVTGDPTLLDGQNYCGTGTLQIISQSNALSIGQYASGYARGGRFSCTIVAIPGSGPTEAPPTCDCGYRQEKRIVGGEETGVNEFTYMSALVQKSNAEIRCGSTIISERYAVTAAHCVNGLSGFEIQYVLLVGDHNIATGEDTQAGAVYEIEIFVVHQNFQPPSLVYDIALIKTRTTIIFSIDVGPVCLPFKYQQTNIDRQMATILGWGSTEFSGPKSDVLLAANISVVPTWECQTQYEETIQPSQLCAYAPGKDSCQFDSGGPLVMNEQQVRRDFLMGVISYGMGCGSTIPGVYTRVTSYVDWITRQTPEVDYCVK